MSDDSLRSLGPATQEELELIEWFEKREASNLDRLESGAENITKLVTGLYGVLFAVLALKDEPVYLALPAVRWLGLAAILAFFVALVAALVTTYPFPTGYQEDNLSEMARGKKQILARKEQALSIALACFLVGALMLAILLGVLLFRG